MVSIPNIKIGNVFIYDLKAAVVDDAVLDFGYDNDRNHVAINGLLGWDIIQHFHWHFDNLKSRLFIKKPVLTYVNGNME